jgi:leucyl aminopeptidase
LELDAQWLVNLGFSAAGAFGMWIVNRLTTSVQKIEDDIKEFPLRYVAKNDYRSDIADIKTMLHDIYQELRKKADK